MPVNEEEDELELRQTYESLSIILSDEAAFEAVLSAVFDDIDDKGDARLDKEELNRYITEACDGMGLPPPHKGQIQGIFHQLVSCRTFTVFLHHLHRECYVWLSCGIMCGIVTFANAINRS